MTHRYWDRPPLLALIGLLAGGVVVALLAAEIVYLLMAGLRRRSPVLANLTRHTRRPCQLVLVAATELFLLGQVDQGVRWQGPVWHAVLLLLIGATGWLVAALSLVVEDVALARLPIDMRDNRHARRVRTQVTVIRRVTVAVIVVVALGSMLMTFREARTAGASLLASAGVVGVIAGFAAQSLLGNVIAGLQIAFSDSLRLDDVVVVRGEWGRIQEITLSYVVVHIWDDRRLILPTSYFTTQPFENWTRTDAAILGVVLLEVDWSVPVEAAREELRRVVGSTELWDRRVAVLQVTDAINGFVQLRALVSASDAPTTWDLRCLVRERLVGWLQQHHPGALPRIRAELAHTRIGPDEPAPEEHVDREARVFGGSVDGEARAQRFTGPSDS